MYDIAFTTTVLTQPVTVSLNNSTETIPSFTINNGGTYITPCTTVQVSEANNLGDFNIYPNPCTTNATLNFTSAITGNANILLHDIYGREVLAQKINVVSGANTFKINVSKLAAGVYTVQVGNGATKYFAKVVVE